MDEQRCEQHLPESTTDGGASSFPRCVLSSAHVDNGQHIVSPVGAGALSGSAARFLIIFSTLTGHVECPFGPSGSLREAWHGTGKDDSHAALSAPKPQPIGRPAAY